MQSIYYLVGQAILPIKQGLRPGFTCLASRRNSWPRGVGTAVIVAATTASLWSSCYGSSILSKCLNIECHCLLPLILPLVGKGAFHLND